MGLLIVVYYIIQIKYIRDANVWYTYELAKISNKLNYSGFDRPYTISQKSHSDFIPSYTRSASHR